MRRRREQLGPGTAGYTTSGAAYRGTEIANATGQPAPADPGFPVTRVGLHPGQGVGVQGTTVHEKVDLSNQEINQAARPGGEGQ